jgi:arabinan endo-1,5-alpha-L-arabinosidase
MKPRYLATACMLLLSASCSTLTDRPCPSIALTNPVIDSDFPDPAALRAADGWYYVYATQGTSGGAMHNIQVARSRDLAQWERLPDALPAKPAWASKTQDFWAPHVSEHDGKYYLYYSAKPDVALTDAKLGLCLAVATADRPGGPFIDVGHPLQCGEGFINIDPMAFDDPATGKRLLYWGSGFKPIKVQELALDRVSFAAGSTPLDLIAPDATDDPANYRRLVEGAWVVRRDGYYYLFFSGDNCCGTGAHYATLVARSRSATGPFEMLTQADGKTAKPVIAADSRWLAPGHNSVIEDSYERSWTLYHAVDRTNSRAAPTAQENSRRVMLISKLEWVEGWPVLVGSN